MHFAVVGYDAVTHWKCEVESPSLARYVVHDMQGFNVVVKLANAMFHAGFGKRHFTVVPKGSVTQVVSEGYGFDQFGIEPQIFADGT